MFIAASTAAAAAAAAAAVDGTMERGKFTAPPLCVCGVQMVIGSPIARSVRLIGTFTAL